MSYLTCPHCKEQTISWWQKYKAAKWGLVYCAKCGKRSCSHPFILVAYTLAYTWDVMLFGYLYFLTKNVWYLVTLIVVWIILDIFSVYLPLSAMKSKSAAPPAND